jgi:hypothetical protein
MNGTILGVLFNLHPICVSLRLAGVAGQVYGYSDGDYQEIPLPLFDLVSSR